MKYEGLFSESFATVSDQGLGGDPNQCTRAPAQPIAVKGLSAGAISR
jgi:hypothetical protein